MIAFVVRRFASALVTVLLAAVVVFSALLVTPGDPAEIILGINASPQALAALRSQLGLDRPAPVRFAEWIGGVVRGDLGQSLNYRRPVATLIADAARVSVPLALASMLLACLVAVPLGVAAALRQGRPADPIITSLAQLGHAVPSFWLGLLLILLFSVQLGWLPSGGFVRWERDTVGALRSLLLPTVALALGQAAVITRMTRAAMLDVLAMDFVRTARAKGLPFRSVVLGHALRNALVTLVTIIGLSLAQLLVGAIVIERVFSLPGLGSLVLTSIGTRDFPLLQGLVLLYAVALVGLNFLVDVSYSVLDPRIRYG